MSFLHPIKDPVDGVAHVVGVSAVDPQFMRQPCTMQLVIQAQGVPAFPLKDDFEIWTNQWPDPGDVLPVTFDREHHERIKIHWDQVATGAETAEADAAALAAQLNASRRRSGLRRRSRRTRSTGWRSWRICTAPGR